MTAPTLYHHFGDKEGLLRAVVAQGVADFMRMKRANMRTANALDDLRRGWDSWIEFAIQRPRLFGLMVENARTNPSASREAFLLMRNIVERLEAEGKLTTEVDEAARAIWAASNGMLALCSQGVGGEPLEATSKLLFGAIVEKLTGQPA